MQRIHKTFMYIFLRASRVCEEALSGFSVAGKQWHSLAHRVSAHILRYCAHRSSSAGLVRKTLQWDHAVTTFLW